MNKENFIIENQFQLYLQRVGLKPEMLPPQQLTEMRRCFFGAWGQFLVLMMEDLADMPEDDGVHQLEDMRKQVGDFFLNETQKKN